MGRATLIELGHLLGGLAIAVALTAGMAWAYPVGAATVWWCGGGAMVATALLAIGPLRRARALDRQR